MRRLRAELHDLRRRLDVQAGGLPPERPVVPLQAPPPGPPAPRRDIEALLTLRWGMWLGAAALLLSGVFLIRYAADEGWLTPGVRCIGLALLGALLIGVAEALRRRAGTDVAGQPALPDLAPAALAGGGSSMLFAAAYAADSLYRLVPAAAGLTLIASASFAALALSLRFGRLVAAIGIAGAFATPALIQDGQASAPMLFGYLLLVSLAGLALQRRIQWDWLGWATLLAGGGWTAFAVLSTSHAGPSSGLWAPSLFAPLSAALHLASLRWNRPVQASLSHVRLAIAAIGVPGAALLLLALASGSTMPATGLLLLAPVAVAASRGDRAAGLPWLAALGPLLLLGAWAQTGWLQDGLASSRFVPAVAAADALGLGAFGLWTEARRVRPLGWAALPAVLPGLTLAIWYLSPRLGHRLADLPPWLAAACLLAAGLAVRAWSCRRTPQRAGIHAAGTVAALALVLAWTLHAVGLPLAGLAGLAPLLPALATIAVRTGPGPLRRVALVPAVLLPVWPLLALAAEPALLSDPAALTVRLPALLVSLVCTGQAAWLFRNARLDALDRLLEAGTALLAALLVAATVRSLAGSGRFEPAFAEASLQVAGLWLETLAWLMLSQRPAPAPTGRPWRAIGIVALTASLLLMLHPPLLEPDRVGTLPLLDALLPAYAVPALAALLAARRLPAGRLSRWLSRFALLSGFGWLSLEVRHLFHPAAMALSAAPVDEIELWALSGAWLGFGAALMAAGLVLLRPGLRQAALLILGLTAVKALLVDTGGLAGIWRVLSFLGLGLTLIASGAAYRRFGNETLTAPDVADLHKPEETP